MGKNSNFKRNPKDFYPTPYECVLPLLPHIITSRRHQKITFIEPCAGDGRLVRHLQKHGLSCTYASDIEPQADFIHRRDALFFDGPFPQADYFITNPPWERDILHQMIEIFRVQAPTWLLLDADYMFTKQAKPYLAFCSKIVSGGRASWMENDVSGKDNFCWYLFGAAECRPIFLP